MFNSQEALTVCKNAEPKNLEQLITSQKLEAIGVLAAGIAHEINTPTQFISDNMFFLQRSFNRIINILKKYAQLLDMNKRAMVTPELIAECDKMTSDINVDSLLGEIPIAIKESQDGLRHVTDIVQSMKTFTHPDNKGKTLVDINKLIQSTLVVSRNAWKYIANMETEYGEDLPPVPCYPSELSQVILNLIINATHAIEENTDNENGETGGIYINTNCDDNWVEIRISDTGKGIPEKYRSRIFEPFFTTKKVGKGTGQGLAIAHFVVVRKHNGKITFTTEIGNGTTFIIRLPLFRSPEEGKRHEKENTLC